MNTSLACQERVLGKLVLAEALGRGLNMRRAMDLVCRGWKTNLTLAQPLGCIIRCKNIPGTPVNYPATRKGLVICMFVSVLETYSYDEQVETSSYFHLLEVWENMIPASLLWFVIPSTSCPRRSVS